MVIIGSFDDNMQRLRDRVESRVRAGELRPVESPSDMLYYDIVGTNKRLIGDPGDPDFHWFVYELVEDPEGSGQFGLGEEVSRGLTLEDAMSGIRQEFRRSKR